LEKNLESKEKNSELKIKELRNKLEGEAKLKQEIAVLQKKLETESKESSGKIFQLHSKISQMKGK